jgi:hypothetical protein
LAWFVVILNKKGTREMNANELADGVETIAQNNSNLDEQIRGFMVDTATMLRQQQAEIEALKAEREIMFGFIKSRGEVGQLIVYKASLEAQEK